MYITETFYHLAIVSWILIGIILIIGVGIFIKLNIDIYIDEEVNRKLTKALLMSQEKRNDD